MRCCRRGWVARRAACVWAALGGFGVLGWRALCGNCEVEMVEVVAEGVSTLSCGVGVR